MAVLIYLLEYNNFAPTWSGKLSNVWIHKVLHVSTHKTLLPKGGGHTCISYILHFKQEVLLPDEFFIFLLSSIRNFEITLRVILQLSLLFVLVDCKRSWGTGVLPPIARYPEKLHDGQLWSKNLVIANSTKVHVIWMKSCRTKEFARHNSVAKFTSCFILELYSKCIYE